MELKDYDFVHTIERRQCLDILIFLDGGLPLPLMRCTVQAKVD